MNIEVTTRPNEKDARTLAQGIIDFNRLQVPDLEPVEEELKFFVFARDASGEIIGGSRAACYWNTLHIELLWLSETCRGEGTGRKIIVNTENFAREKGFEKAFVETTSWQAKPFYEKLGYVHIATLNDRPKGHASHYLVKDLS